VPDDRHHGVYCCVLVVVVLVDGGGTDIGGGADVVVVRSVDVDSVLGLDPQAASSAVPPSSAAVNNSRIGVFVLVMGVLLVWGRIWWFGVGSGGLGSDLAHGAPIRQSCYCVFVVVVVCCVVVTGAGSGYVVVFVTLSAATPLLVP
jgi:hypothetical protein